MTENNRKQENPENYRAALDLYRQGLDILRDGLPESLKDLGIELKPTSDKIGACLQGVREIYESGIELMNQDLIDTSRKLYNQNSKVRKLLEIDTSPKDPVKSLEVYFVRRGETISDKLTTVGILKAIEAEELINSNLNGRNATIQTFKEFQLGIMLSYDIYELENLLSHCLGGRI